MSDLILANALKVDKTIKLFIGGEFPRTESGRTVPVHLYGTPTVYAQICRGSRKDLRNAVTAAVAALQSWESKSAYKPRSDPLPYGRNGREQTRRVQRNAHGHSRLKTRGG